MQKLRRLHLYLGCFFAPMLLFFAISGIWQTFRLNDKIPILKTLSAIHTSHTHKGPGWQPTSPYLELFVVAMSVGLVFSIIIGVIMAFKFGRGKLTLASLAAGILIPLTLILFLG
jgi:hypothetical protein